MAYRDWQIVTIPCPEDDGDQKVEFEYVYYRTEVLNKYELRNIRIVRRDCECVSADEIFELAERRWEEGL